MNKNRKTLLAGSALAVGSFLMTSPLSAAFPIVLGNDDLGELTIGGAIRANYTVGDYNNSPSSEGTSAYRGGSGAVTLDTFRINLDYENGPWSAKGEYRFYPVDGNTSYHFLHTAWIGYDLDTGDQVQVGLNRTPFGAGPYGTSQSWFFDQHYYVGLADNMNVGIKYIHNQVENWTIDFAAYVMSAPSGTGTNSEASRYSYDVVNASGGEGYRERGQVNVRAVTDVQFGEVESAIGGSAQYGILAGRGGLSDEDMFALAIHAVNQWEGWNLTGQLSYYEYSTDGNSVEMGAYNFTTPVADKAWVPAVSLSYFYEANQIDWLDSITPYVEYSSVIKTESGWNDSEMAVIGAAFATGGWYTYVDLAFSNGNDFIGNRDTNFDQYAQNSNQSWMTRFNINFGYYF